MLTVEQANDSPNKNLVTRALGIEAVVPPDIAEYRAEAEDIDVLCSDGLTDMVEPDVVQQIVTAKRSDLAEAAAELIDVANQNGGRENVSVVLVRASHLADSRLAAALDRKESHLNRLGIACVRATQISRRSHFLSMVQCVAAMSGPRRKSRLPA